jgi:hypothetical protein
MEVGTPFSREVLARLPLAESALALLRQVLADEPLRQLYFEHRGQSYEALITFPHLTEVMAEALLSHRGSLAAALEVRLRDGQTVATRQAYYGKLRRLPPDVSVAFFRHTARRAPHRSPRPRPAGRASAPQHRRARQPRPTTHPSFGRQEAQASSEAALGDA